MNKRFRFLTFGAILSVFLIFPIFANAAVDGQGLTISPPISDITLQPGQSVTEVIKINNPTNRLIEVYPKTMNFKASGETGEPAFYDVGDGAEKFALASWISLNPNKIALAPEQIVEFSYTIKVPQNAEPGGHYGAVFFANDPFASDTNSSSVSMGSMIGSLVLVRVPGEVTEKGQFDSMSTDKPFYLSNKVIFSSRITNLGNVHFKPIGEIIVKDMFGSDVDRLVFNDQNGNVLPDSTRKFTNTWQPGKILIGRYTAKASLVYGASGKTLDATVSFWIIPLWFIILMALLIVAIVVLVIWLLRKRGKKTPPRRPQPPMPPRPPQPQPQPQRPVDQPKGPIILR